MWGLVPGPGLVILMSHELTPLLFLSIGWSCLATVDDSQAVYMFPRSSSRTWVVHRASICLGSPVTWKPDLVSVGQWACTTIHWVILYFLCQTACYMIFTGSDFRYEIKQKSPNHDLGKLIPMKEALPSAGRREAWGSEKQAWFPLPLLLLFSPPSLSFFPLLFEKVSLSANWFWTHCIAKPSLDPRSCCPYLPGAGIIRGHHHVQQICLFLLGNGDGTIGTLGTKASLF